MIFRMIGDVMILIVFRFLNKQLDFPKMVNVTNSRILAWKLTENVPFLSLE